MSTEKGKFCATSTQQRHSNVKAAPPGLEESQYDQKLGEFLQVVDTDSKTQSFISSTTFP